jgi:hypothetical protein
MSERVVYYYQDVNSISWRNSSRLFCHKVGQKVDHCFFLSKLREMSRNEAVEAASFFFFDKRDDLSFSMIYCSHLDSNIPLAPTYGVHDSQLIP